jgi:hypothetical protein
MSRLFALLLAGAGIILAQSSSTITLSNGLQLRIETQLGQPTGQETLKIEMARASGDSFYRIFRDQNRLAVFAYELGVSLSNSGDAVELTAKPTLTDFAARFPSADGGKPVPTLSETRTLPPLDSGGQAEIGLFELEGVGLRVVDNISVELGPPAGGDAASLDRMRLAGLKLKVNGTALLTIGPGGPVAGKYAMFYIPGRGAYIMTPQPVDAPGFIKAGSIDGAKLRFTWNNETIEADAASPILGGPGTGELWVKFDPSFRPLGNWTKARSADGPPKGDEFFAGASDSLNWWLP